MKRIKERLEVSGLVMNLLTKMAIVSGGLIFLIYCGKTGAFPDNLSLGDGVWLLFIIAVFSFGLAVLYFFLGCLGYSFWTLLHCVYRFSGGRARLSETLSEWKLKLFLRRMNKSRSTFFKTLKRTKPFLYKLRFPEAGLPFHLLSLIPILFMMIFIRENYFAWYAQLLTSAIGLSFAFLLIHTNWQRSKQIRFIEYNDVVIVKLKKEIFRVNILFTVSLLGLITLYIGLVDIAVNKTMEFLHIRSENVTIYVKKPWDSVLQVHPGLVSQPNSTRSDNADAVPGYKQFDKMTVALANLGGSVFVEFDEKGKIYSLKIPASEVIVDKLPERKP